MAGGLTVVPCLMLSRRGISNLNNKCCCVRHVQCLWISELHVQQHCMRMCMCMFVSQRLSTACLLCPAVSATMPSTTANSLCWCCMATERDDDMSRGDVPLTRRASSKCPIGGNEQMPDRLAIMRLRVGVRKEEFLLVRTSSRSAAEHSAV